MSIWNEIYELFIPKDELDKRKEQSFKDAKNKEKNLFNELDKLDKEYTDSLPKKEEKDYSGMFMPFSKKEKVDNTLSNEELNELAYNKAYIDYDKKIDNINNLYELRENKANKNKDKVVETGINILSDLNNKMAINDNNIDSLMQKKGLVYSSIKDNLHNENKENIDKKKSDSIKTTKRYLDNINDTVKAILEEKNDSIKNLDIESEDKYQDLYDSLVKNRNKEKQKINDYNEQVRQEKITYDNNVNRKIQSMKENDRKKEQEQERLDRENEYKYGYTGDKKVNFDKRLNLAIEFYDTLPKDLALRVASNNLELKRYLGVYYEPLIKHISSRYERKKIFS